MRNRSSAQRARVDQRRDAICEPFPADRSKGNEADQPALSRKERFTMLKVVTASAALLAGTAVLAQDAGELTQSPPPAPYAQVSELVELPELRLVFLLREAKGLSVLAIARDLRLNPITVRTRLFRARRQLRVTLEARLRGGFETVFPFDGARCASMADKVVAKLRGGGHLRQDPHLPGKER